MQNETVAKRPGKCHHKNEILAHHLTQIALCDRINEQATDSYNNHPASNQIECNRSYQISYKSRRELMERGNNMRKSNHIEYDCDATNDEIQFRHEKKIIRNFSRIIFAVSFLRRISVRYSIRKIWMRTKRYLFIFFPNELMQQNEQNGISISINFELKGNEKKGREMMTICHKIEYWHSIRKTMSFIAQHDIKFVLDRQ